MLFDPGGVVAIADAAVRTATDRALRGRLTAAGLQRAAEFSWDGATRSIDERFERLATSR